MTTHQKANTDAPPVQGPLHRLTAAGAHLVLTNGTFGSGNPKRPFFADTSLRTWRDSPTAPDVVDAFHRRGCGVAVVPASLGLVVVDVDNGSPDEVWDRVGQPLVAVETVRGCHGYYADTHISFVKCKFRVGDASGDILHGPGAYAILHGHGVKTLADAVYQAGERPSLQMDLFFDHAPSPSPSPQTLTVRPEAGSAILEEVRKGRRHISLFNAVRFYAYAVKRDATLARWTGRILAFAQQENRRFVLDGPLPASEVRAMAFAVAKWTWTRTGYDHSRQAQRRRVIKRWHGKGSDKAVADIDRRNARILELRHAGWTLARIGDHVGVSLQRVSQILKNSST